MLRRTGSPRPRRRQARPRSRCAGRHCRYRAGYRRSRSAGGSSRPAPDACVRTASRLRCLSIGMLDAVYLDDQLLARTGEIDDVAGQSGPVAESQGPSADGRVAHSKASVRHRSSRAASISHCCGGAVNDVVRHGSSLRRRDAVGREAGALRCPPLSCRTSPPQGGRSAVSLAFANLQRCRRLAKAARAADLPPCGGDVRQDRGGRCPANVSADAAATSPLHLPGGDALAGGRVLAVLQLDALRQQLVADAVGLGPVLLADEGEARVDRLIASITSRQRSRTAIRSPACRASSMPQKCSRCHRSPRSRQSSRITASRLRPDSASRTQLCDDALTSTASSIASHRADRRSSIGFERFDRRSREHSPACHSAARPSAVRLG